VYRFIEFAADAHRQTSRFLPETEKAKDPSNPVDPVLYKEFKSREVEL
jgi:hypothetical protein